MLKADELLAALRERGVKNAQVEETLGLPSSRVAEIFGKRRRLQYDEGVQLIERFGIADPALEPLSIPVARLVVLYLAEAVGSPLRPEDPRVEELARDIRAFSSFASDPRRRQSPEAAEGFFQGLRSAPDRKVRS